MWRLTTNHLRATCQTYRDVQNQVRLSKDSVLKAPHQWCAPETLFLTHPMAGPSLVNVTMKPMVQATRSTTSNNAEGTSPSTDLHPGSSRLRGTSTSTPAFGRTTSTYSESQRQNMCLRRCSRNGPPHRFTLEVSIPCALDRRLVEVLPSEHKRRDHGAWASRIVNSCICLAQCCPQTAVSFASRMVETKFWDARKPSHINRDHSCGDTIRIERICKDRLIPKTCHVFLLRTDWVKQPMRSNEMYKTSRRRVGGASRAVPLLLSKKGKLTGQSLPGKKNTSTSGGWPYKVAQLLMFCYIIRWCYEMCQVSKTCLSYPKYPKWSGASKKFH